MPSRLRTRTTTCISVQLFPKTFYTSPSNFLLNIPILFSSSGNSMHKAYLPPNSHRIPYFSTDSILPSHHLHSRRKQINPQTQPLSQNPPPSPTSAPNSQTPQRTPAELEPSRPPCRPPTASPFLASAHPRDCGGGGSRGDGDGPAGLGYFLLPLVCYLREKSGWRR